MIHLSKRLITPLSLTLCTAILSLMFIFTGLAVYFFAPPSNMAPAPPAPEPKPIRQFSDGTSAARPAVLTPKPSPAIPLHSGRILDVPILEYHYIADNPNPLDKARDNLSVGPTKFAEQMKYLSDNGYHTISLNTYYAALHGGGLPSRPIILSFDDGYIDFYTNAFPILKQYRFTAVAFIPTSLVGGSYYLSWPQIEELARTGLVEFESHSLTHPNLTALSPSELTRQLMESKQILSSHTGTPVNFFCYPYGISNTSVQQAARAAGYIGAIGTWYSLRNSEGTLFNMGRVKVSGDWSIQDFAKRV